MPDKHSLKVNQEKGKGWLRRLVGTNQFGRKLFLAFAFILSLTYFLHFREVRMELFKIGTVAPRYVIAQIDFEFPDKEATELLKQESARDIEAIFKIDQEQVHSFRQDFENQLIDHPEWKQSLKSTFEKLYTVLEEAEKDLIQARFTSEGTLQKMQEIRVEDDHFYSIPSFPKHLSSNILPSSFWELFIKQIEDGHSFQSKTIQYVVDAFSQHSWTLQEDVSLERYLRQVVQEGMPNKYTHIEAGSQIITRGETVTSGHITMLQSMKIALSNSLTLWTPLTLLGSALLSLCLTLVTVIYLRIFHPHILSSLRKMTLLFTIVILTLLLAKGAEYLLLYQSDQIVETIRFQLVVPFAALLVCILIGSEMALFISFFLTIILGVTLAVDPVFLLLVNFFASLVAIFFARSLHKRKEVFAVCTKVWLFCIPLLIIFNLIENTFWNINLVTDLVSSFGFMTIIAVLTVSLLPILEFLFQVMTDMTLMEYMDPNHELLRRLSVEAPGTYQHSLVVGNLAEVSARAINANGLFCRVATLYHDIGKLFNPHYFTENQLGGFNIHQLLTPLESSQVIIAHVSEGESLAIKHGLPQSFIDIIKEHHGTTLVYYFYCKQLEHMHEDVKKVNQNLFRYRGPKPGSKESGIIMLADSLEGASRSMDQITEESIMQMIEKLVLDKIQDGQLDECQLTFQELGVVKKTMAKAIMISRHLRIKYPDRH